MQQISINTSFLLPFKYTTLVIPERIRVLVVGTPISLPRVYSPQQPAGTTIYNEQRSPGISTHGERSYYILIITLLAYILLQIKNHPQSIKRLPYYIIIIINFCITINKGRAVACGITSFFLFFHYRLNFTTCAARRCPLMHS